MQKTTELLVVKSPEDALEFTRNLSHHIKTYDDFPKPGIRFKNIQSILIDPRLSNNTLKAIHYQISAMYEEDLPDLILGFDARGFLFGFPYAMSQNLPFVMARKKGKLPGDLVSVEFEKEYGKDTLCIQKGLIKPGMKVLIHDDLLATGGTAQAAVELIEDEGGLVFGFHFIMELGYLGGRKLLEQYCVPIVSLVHFENPED